MPEPHPLGDAAEEAPQDLLWDQERRELEDWLDAKAEDEDDRFREHAY